MTRVARLKVVLDHVEPRVTRRFEVPVSVRLSRLHTVLQIILGWTNSHLYEFSFNGVTYSIPDPDWDFHCIDARLASLSSAIRDNDTLAFKYLYDLGDGWSHSIKVEKIEPAIPGLNYPFFIQGSGRCPPEDVGGPHAYSEFLDVIADPSHPDHDELLTWAGGSFNPNFVDVAAIDRQLSALKPRPRKTKPA